MEPEPTPSATDESTLKDEALEPSTAAVLTPEQAAEKAKEELQAERTRATNAEIEVSRLNKILQFALQENKRLREVLGEAAKAQLAPKKAAPSVVRQPSRPIEKREPEVYPTIVLGDGGDDFDVEITQ